MKIAFITGATSGIGKATAEQLAQHGFALILCGRREDRLKELSAELQQRNNIKTQILCFDVQHYEQTKTAIDSLPNEWKEIDVLVNNAGLASGLNPIQSGDINDWEIMINTNVKGLLYVTRLIAPSMVARNKGHIVNVSSIAGKETYPNGNVYCATKHAVDSLSKAMRMDMLPHNVKVTNVAPGMVETEFSIVRFHGDEDKAKTTYKGVDPLTAADIADTIYFAISRPAHVNISDITITASAQASARDVIRKTV